MGEENAGPMAMPDSKDIGMEMEGKYIPKQFDLDLIASMDETTRNIVLSLIASGSNNTMFREEIRTTLQSYNVIIDQREDSINQLLKG